MKAYVKVIIAGAVIFAVGLIAFIALLGVNGWSLNANWEIKTYECEADNTELKLDYSAGEVNTVFYGGDKIKVEYPESDGYKTEVKEENGKLSVISGKRHWYNVSLWSSKIPEATVYIPRGSVLKLDLNLNAGRLNISDGQYGDIRLVMNAGTVGLGEIVCKDFKAEINAGTFDCKKIDAFSIVTELNAGSASLREVTCGHIAVEVNAGSLNLDISGIESEYSVSVNRSAGSCNLLSHSGSTSKSLDIEVNAGSCNARFTG